MHPANVLLKSIECCFLKIDWSSKQVELASPAQLLLLSSYLFKVCSQDLNQSFGSFLMQVLVDCTYRSQFFVLQFAEFRYGVEMNFQEQIVSKFVGLDFVLHDLVPVLFVSLQRLENLAFYEAQVLWGS